MLFVLRLIRFWTGQTFADGVEGVSVMQEILEQAWLRIAHTFAFWGFALSLKSRKVWQPVSSLSQPFCRAALLTSRRARSKWSV